MFRIFLPAFAGSHVGSHSAATLSRGLAPRRAAQPSLRRTMHAPAADPASDDMHRARREVALLVERIQASGRGRTADPVRGTPAAGLDRA